MEHPMTNLPCCILETVLSYILESYKDVAILSSVCKNWFFELKDLSPATWKILLERKKWPSLKAATCEKYAIQSSNPHWHQLSYVCHHRASKILKSIQLGTTALFINNRLECNQQRSIKENIVIENIKIKNRYIHCKSLKIWKSSHLISAYLDCSIRVHAILMQDGGNLKFREIVCLKKNRAKDGMALLSMEVSDDDDNIAFLCKKKIDGEKDQCFLGLIDCNDLVNSHLDPGLNSNIENRANYYELHSYNVSVGCRPTNFSNEFVSCGKGLYLFESMFTLDSGNDARGLCLFSIIKNCFLWVHILPYPTTIPFLHMTVQRTNHSNLHTSNNNIKMIALYSGILITPFSILVNNENTSIVSKIAIDSFLLPSYALDGYRLISRKIVALHSHLIVADTYENLWRGHFQYIPKVNIIPIGDLQSDSNVNGSIRTSNELTLSIRNRKIYHMCPITTKQIRSNDYIILFLKSMVMDTMIGVVVHVPTKTEISRMDLKSEVLASTPFIKSECDKDFLILGVPSLGEFNIIANSMNNEIVDDMVKRIESHREILYEGM